MPNWLANQGIAIVAVVVGAVIALFGLMRPTPPPIEVRPREPQPSPTVVIYVHIDGAVQSPGVYALAGGSRVFEAIDSAGGLAQEGDVRELNLAARVADGQKLVIPARPQPPAEAPVEGAAVPAPTAARSVPPANTSASDAKINVNTASQRMLESLPGIGPVIAGRIVDYRQANGPFTRVEQLRDARLVNNATFERIRALISVD